MCYSEADICKVSIPYQGFSQDLATNSGSFSLSLSLSLSLSVYVLLIAITVLYNEYNLKLMHIVVEQCLCDSLLFSQE